MKSDGIATLSLQRLLSRRDQADFGDMPTIGKPVLHIYHTRKERIFNQDSLRLQVHALTDFLRSNKLEVLNVAGPRESKEPRRFTSGLCRVGKGRVGDRQSETWWSAAILD